MHQKKLFNIYGATGGNFAGNVYDAEHIAPALSTMGGGNQQPIIVEMNKDTSFIQRPHGFNKGGFHSISPALTKSSFENNNVIMENTKKNIELPAELQDKKFRIRKLTPRECFRLMGVDDADIDRIQAYPYEKLIEHPAYSKQERASGMTEKEKRKLMKDSISNSAQYKLAGNSIVVDVLFHLFRKLFIETGAEKMQGKLF